MFQLNFHDCFASRHCVKMQIQMLHSNSANWLKEMNAVQIETSFLEIFKNQSLSSWACFTSPSRHPFNSEIRTFNALPSCRCHVRNKGADSSLPTRISNAWRRKEISKSSNLFHSDCSLERERRRKLMHHVKIYCHCSDKEAIKLEKTHLAANRTGCLAFKRIMK